jgi:ATP phosphoribosyltransferase
MITIAVPKGRLLTETLGLLEKAGIRFRGKVEESRKLIHHSSDRALRILVIRSQDVNTFVERGGADMGVAGKDLIEEQRPDLYEPIDLGIGYCRLVLAAPEGKEPGGIPGPLTVATKYPRITESFFSITGREVEIVKLYGSIELAPLIEMADAIVDLVSTGRTLKANRLVEVETIMESTARLVVNRASFRLKHSEIISLTERIGGVL